LVHLAELSSEEAVVRAVRSNATADDENAAGVSVVMGFEDENPADWHESWFAWHILKTLSDRSAKPDLILTTSSVNEREISMPAPSSLQAALFWRCR